MTDTQLLIGIEAVARTLGVSRQTIYRQVAAGVLPKPVHFGGVKFIRSEIDAFIANRCEPVSKENRPCRTR